jgi:hypothetical protein
VVVEETLRERVKGKLELRPVDILEERLLETLLGILET